MKSHSYSTTILLLGTYVQALPKNEARRQAKARIENLHLEKFDDYSMNAIVDLHRDVVKNLALPMLEAAAVLYCCCCVLAFLLLRLSEKLGTLHFIARYLILLFIRAELEGE